MSRKTAISPTRHEDFSQWYQEVIYASDLAEHSPVRGCMVIKPWGYAIWERMQSLLDKQFKKRHVSNIYCPLLIPVEFLEKEAKHVEGFATECAVVTHHRLELGEDGKMVPASPLAEPYVIRPTSEAMVGHMFSKWVQSYRDLPLLINQWANVMRWEMRPRLFLRTSEFLWQEGHTVHADETSARSMSEDMIACYQTFFEDVLAIPVIKGEKTALERFAGAETTWTIEAMMQDGKALQAGTSHFLAQYFSKSFDIQYTSSQEERLYAWTTSWGVSTRMVGGVVMSHGDDDGLVLPPMLSPQQVVIIPVIHKAALGSGIMDYVRQVEEILSGATVMNEELRLHVDTRDMSGGDKKWSWVKRGVPLRIEIGQRECEASNVVVTRRDTLERVNVELHELHETVKRLLLDIQSNIWNAAHERTTSQIQRIESASAWEAVCDGGVDGSGYLVPWDGCDEDEMKLNQRQLSIRCLLPHDHPWINAEKDVSCVVSARVCQRWALIAKSY